MMDTFMIVVVIAMLVEAVVQVVKGWVPTGAAILAWLWQVVSAALGVLVCVLAKVDVFALLGVEMGVPVVGYALSGVLVSRGASFVHDLWDRVKEGGASLEGVEITVGETVEGEGE